MALPQTVRSVGLLAEWETWGSDSGLEVAIKLSRAQLVAAIVLLGCVALFIHHLYTRANAVYLLGFHCYKPPDSFKVSYQLFRDRIRALGHYTEDSQKFSVKVLERSGLGEDTYLPAGTHLLPQDLSMRRAKEEAEMVIFTCVERVLAEQRVTPKQVDILIVNCSLFNPTPSLAAMIINRFKMRSNTIVYNLGGMGCSAGIIAIALAQDLLQTYSNVNCLVMSTENITQNLYNGNQKSMLIPNCLFRVGGAAILLSNKRKDKWHAKYRLKHCVRVHMGADDAAYHAVHQQEDAEGKKGVHLSKDLMIVAGRALKANIVKLGHMALPLSEKLRFVQNLIGRKVFNSGAEPYTPDFQKAFEHFCIHTGGRGVIDAIEKQLQLSQATVHPSRQTLFRYGNVSSSSVWYVLAHIEHHQGVKSGERVWQIAFGSGFKCNSAVWQALRPIAATHEVWT